MLRIYYGDEIAHTANDLRNVIRQCIKQWQPALTARQCQVTVDLNVSMPVLCQAEDTYSLIQGIFELTISRLPERGELSIIGCRSTSAVELEIADSGSLLECETRHSRLTFPRCAVVNDRRLAVLQNLAITFGGRMWATPCPQGGMAWTLRLPARATAKRAA